MRVAYRMKGRVAGPAIGRDDCFWTESEASYSIVGNQSVSRLSTELCLWYFFFESSGPCFKYLGFLDFDVSGYDFQTMTNAEIVRTFKKEFEEPLNEAFKDDWMAYFSGTKGFHVYVLRPEFIFRIESEKSQHHSQMVAALQSLLPESLFKRIDTSIYAMRKGVRPWTLQNPKTKRYRPIRIAPEECTVYDEYSFFDWFDQTLNSGTVNNCLLAENHVPKELSVPRTPDFAGPGSLQVAVSHLPPSTESLRTWIKDTLKLQSLPDVHRVDENGYIYFTEGWCFCDPGELTQHSNRKTWWKLSGSRATQRCLAQRHREMEFVIDFDASGRNQMTVVDFNADYLPDQVTLVPENEQYLPYDLVRDMLLPEGSMLCVFSPMGTGKTHCLNRLLQDNPQTLKRVLVIGTRISQCSVFQGAFEGFANYLDQRDRPLYEVDRLVVCLNSLMKVTEYDAEGKGFVLPYYDLLVVDEVMTLLNALVSPLLANVPTYQPAVFELFKLLLKTSGRVVMMDGLPGPQLYRYLASKEVDVWHRCKILKHARPAEKKKFIFMKDPYAVIERMDACLYEKNESIVVVSDSKGILNFLSRRLQPDIAAMTICGDASHEVKRSANDPRTNWKRLRYLGYNTALGPGASFDARTAEEGAFHEIFVFVTCQTSSPSEIYQLISRIRHPLNNRVHVCIINTKNKTSVLADVIKKSEEEQLAWMVDQLFTNILTVDKRIQSLPLAVKRKRDDISAWTKWKLRGNPPELVRELTSKQRLMLCYEQNDFVNLIAWARLEALKTSDSAAFEHELRRLIRLGGGVLEIVPAKEDTAKSQAAFLKESQTEGATLETYHFPATDLKQRLAPGLVEEMQKMIKLENYRVQARFFSVMRHLRNPDGAEDRFSKQVEALFMPPPQVVEGCGNEKKKGIMDISRFSRVPLNLTTTLLELCPPYENLVKLLGLEYNRLTGHIDGTWNSSVFMQCSEEHRAQFVQNFKEIARLRHRVEPRFDPSKINIMSTKMEDYKNDNSVFCRIYLNAVKSCFEWMGLSVVQGSRVRVAPTSPEGRTSRTTNYSFDKGVTGLRYAMAGFKFDDVEEQMTNLDALVYFAENGLV